MVLPKATKDPLLLIKGARAVQNLWRAGDPQAPQGIAVLPTAGVKMAKKMQNLLLVPRLGKLCERIGWKGWKARQDHLHFYLCVKDKRGSDKDNMGRENMELNKKVSLLMFTADEKQRLKLPLSLFTIKKL